MNKTAEEIRAEKLAKRKLFRDANRERINAQKLAHYHANKERFNEKTKEYQRKNIDRVRAQNAKYKKENRDAILERRRELRNSPKAKQAAKAYRQRTKEHIKKQSKEYSLRKKDELTKKQREKRASDPLFKLRGHVSTLIRNCLANRGVKKGSKTEKILGCTIKEFKDHLESQFNEWMSWSNRGLYNGTINYGWDIDHIIPISSAKTEADVLRLNHYSNFQPLCSYTNRHIKSNYIESPTL